MVSCTHNHVLDWPGWAWGLPLISTKHPYTISLISNTYYPINQMAWPNNYSIFLHFKSHFLQFLQNVTYAKHSYYSHITTQQFPQFHGRIFTHCWRFTEMLYIITQVTGLTGQELITASQKFSTIQDWHWFVVFMFQSWAGWRLGTVSLWVSFLTSTAAPLPVTITTRPTISTLWTTCKLIHKHTADVSNRTVLMWI